jgi:hypothetical protein
LAAPALWPIQYDSDSPVILAVNTSYIAVGFYLCQCNPDSPRSRYYNWFGSIMLNDQEARFSQLKLEIYGLFRGLYTPPHILVDSMYSIGSLQGVYRDFSGTAQGVHGHCL